MLVLVATVLALGAALCGLVGKVGAVAVARADAQIAADAAAFGGVLGGRSAAEELARRNRGAVVTYAAAGGEVEVIVEVGGQRARARAGRR